jgi:hypothetical protein
LQATLSTQEYRFRVNTIEAQGLLPMTRICWLGVLLIGLSVFSNAAMPAPAHRGPAQAPTPQPSGGQNGETRIAAVVNDEVISVADLQSRLRMVMLSSNFPDNEETRQRIAGQVLSWAPPRSSCRFHLGSLAITPTGANSI